MFSIGGRIGGLIMERDEIFMRGGYEHHGKYNLKIPLFYTILGNNIEFQILLIFKIFELM
jgi:hypothetical protein